MEKHFVISQKNSKILSSLDDVELSSLIRYICQLMWMVKKLKVSNARIEALFLVFKLEIDADQQKEIDKPTKKAFYFSKTRSNKKD
jgi:hypothetical protein